MSSCREAMFFQLSGNDRLEQLRPLVSLDAYVFSLGLFEFQIGPCLQMIQELRVKGPPVVGQNEKTGIGVTRKASSLLNLLASQEEQPFWSESL